jgi:hypothetical protein
VAGLVNGPKPWGRKLQKIAVWVAEVHAFTTARPSVSTFDLHAVTGKVIEPALKLAARDCKSHVQFTRAAMAGNASLNPPKTPLHPVPPRKEHRSNLPC